jgi:glucosamine-6-phosphate isomerase
MSPATPTSPQHCKPAVARPRWEWQRLPDSAALAGTVADRIVAALRAKPELLLCLATGASTLRTYELLAARAAKDEALFSRARWIKLDEWLGLAADDPASCELFLRRVLLGPLSLPPSRYCGWEGRTTDSAAECRRIAAWLDREGPVDLQILGLGANGHLGFNEPGAATDSGPHLAQLSATSLSHAMLVGARDPVDRGLTLGLGDILRSRRIFLLVSGAHKAAQLRRLALGEESPDFPASCLHRHPAVTVFCDAAASAQLPAEFFAPGSDQINHPSPASS